MKLKVQSKINAGELFQFLMYHTYSSMWGFIGILISICALLAVGQLCISGGDTVAKICTLLAALLFLAVQPLRLYLQAQRLMESDKGYQEPIDYIFDHSGISLSQGSDTAFYAWGEVEKVISTKKIVAIYVGRKRVFKLSRNDLGDSYEQLREIVRTFAVKAFVKMR
jgi:hypothetical protein